MDVEHSAVMLCCKQCGGMVFVIAQECLAKDVDGRREMDDLLAKGYRMRTASADTVRKSEFCKCR